jgi:hypothetical protein
VLGKESRRGQITCHVSVNVTLRRCTSIPYTSSSLNIYTFVHFFFRKLHLPLSPSAPATMWPGRPRCTGNATLHRVPADSVHSGVRWHREPLQVGCTARGNILQRASFCATCLWHRVLCIVSLRSCCVVSYAAACLVLCRCGQGASDAPVTRLCIVSLVYMYILYVYTILYMVACLVLCRCGQGAPDALVM